MISKIFIYGLNIASSLSTTISNQKKKYAPCTYSFYEGEVNIQFTYFPVNYLMYALKL